MFNSMEIDFRDYQQGDRYLISSWIADSTIDNVQLRDTFMRHFSDVIANGKLIVAIHKDIPVGFSGGKKGTDGTSSDISIIYVTPSYRGNYLGRELLCLLEDYFREDGCISMNVVPPLSEVESGFLGGMGYKVKENGLSKDLSADKMD